MLLGTEGDEGGSVPNYNYSEIEHAGTLMGGAIAFIQWENYECGPTGRGLFASEIVTFNSGQERLHKLRSGDWL